MGRAMGIFLAAAALLGTVSGAPAAVKDRLLVSTGWLAQHLGDPGVIVVAVGAREGYDQGHPPRARWLPMSAVATTRDGNENELPPVADLAKAFGDLGIGNTARVVLYGDQHNLLASRAFMALDYLGQAGRVALLDGGLEVWQAEGRPLARAATAWQPAPFTPRLRPEVVIDRRAVADASWLLCNKARGAVALIDARPAAQYAGDEPGPGIDRGGHIPGARNLYWQDLLASAGRPVLRPTAELQRHFAAAGATGEAPVITYCRTGVQASFDYFVARYLGLDVRLYDGSFMDWSHATGTEVEKGG